MPEDYNNEPSFVERLKKLNLNRPAIVSTALLLVAVLIVTAVAISNNRAKKNDAAPPDDGQIKQPNIEQPKTETEDKTENKPTQLPSDKPSTPVEDKLPSFVLPVSGALSKKHDPSTQVFSNTMNDYRVHLGLDIVTSASAPVYAAADGKIEKIWEDTFMGYCIAIKHSGNCYTIYKNLAETLPEGIGEGVTVRSGQLIASVGESAMVEVAEEPHLHFEMTVADLGVDPLEYFDENALASLGIDASHGE
jgi:murein DD-endopeptidase MepM/ murein hydrolase activator NlpD